MIPNSLDRRDADYRTKRAIRRLGPWTPRIRVFSMSDVRLGPVTITSSPLGSRAVRRGVTGAYAAMHTSVPTSPNTDDEH